MQDRSQLQYLVVFLYKLERKKIASVHGHDITRHKMKRVHNQLTLSMFKTAGSISSFGNTRPPEGPSFTTPRPESAWGAEAGVAGAGAGASTFAASAAFFSASSAFCFASFSAAAAAVDRTNDDTRQVQVESVIHQRHFGNLNA